MGISELLIFAVAIGFLVYAFTGSRRSVGLVLCAGVFLLLGIRFMGARNPRGALVKIAPFEIETSGHKFVFIIDRTASMAEGGERSPLHLAKKQLKRSIIELDSDRLFQIITYDQKPESCLGTPPTLVPANQSQIYRALGVIDDLNAGNGSEPSESPCHFRALLMALDMRPGVIYYVTDGRLASLSDKQLDIIKGLSRRSVIHVVQIVNDAKQPRPQWLEHLATRNGGKFRRVVLDASTGQSDLERTEAANVEPAAGDAGKRPVWVGEEPRFVSEGRRVFVVSTDLYSTHARCRTALDAEIRQAANKYADRILEHQGAGRHVVNRSLLDRIEKETYTEVIKNEDPVIGEMRRMYARIVIDEWAVEYLKSRWRERMLLGAAVAAGLLLGLVGAVFAYLKLDTATRGYYSGRLKFAAGSVIIVLLGLAAVLASKFDLIVL